MKVDFEKKKLAKNCQDDRSRLRAFGKDRAKKVRARLTLLENADSLEDLRRVPGHFHELKSDRAGQFAADLDGPYRLIFRPVLSREQEQDHADGYVWSKITHIRILEITDYHE